jgi:pre-mRNA-splicing factor CWC22
MSGENGKETQTPAIPEGELIEGLKEDPNYFAVKYNEMRKEELSATQDAKDGQNHSNGKVSDSIDQAKPNLAYLGAMATSRAGGVYVPPHKLRKMQEELMKNAQNNEEQRQRIKWEMLRKSINEIINKVNVANIQNVIIELLNENIMRGIGLVGRAVIKAQMASPNFTHVYAALVSVLNTKLPDIAHLIIRRVILQFRRAYQRNNKIVCQATTKFLAHLINQKVLSDLFGLELLIFLLEEPTEDSVDIACDFMKECGQVLSELTPAGVNAIFERFKGILHEGETDRKVQYSIENLFAIRKNKFKDYPGVISELDLVDDEDQITHNIELDSEITGEEHLNIFRQDPFFDKTEEEWKQIKLSILGEDNILRLKASAMQLDEEEEAEPEPQIVDFTEEDLVKLREKIYLIIMNSVDFEECAHKLMRLHIGRGHEEVLSKMIVDCCLQDRSYNKFFGLLAQRFCNIDDVYKKFFFRHFVDHYTVIHRFSTNKIRNLAKFFAHLLLTDALDWHVLRCVTLTEEATTSSSRIFLKILFQDLAENMGLKTLCQRMHDPDMKEFFVGVFPTDHPQNARFAANFFGLIGLDAVAQPLKDSLVNGLMPDEAEKLLLELAEESSSTSSDSDSSSSSSSDSDEKADKKEAPVDKQAKREPKKAEPSVKPQDKLPKADEKPPKQEKQADRPDDSKPKDKLKKKPRLSSSRSSSRRPKHLQKDRKSPPKPTKASRNRSTDKTDKVLAKTRDRKSSSDSKIKKAPAKPKEKPKVFKRKRSSSSKSRSKSSPQKKKVVPSHPKKAFVEDKTVKKEERKSREKEKLRYKLRRDSSKSSSKDRKDKPKVVKPSKTAAKKEKKSSSSSRSSSDSSSSSSSSKSVLKITSKQEKAAPPKPAKEEVKEKLKVKRRSSKDRKKSSSSSSSSSKKSDSSSSESKKRKRSRSKEKKAKDEKSKKPETIEKKKSKQEEPPKPKEKLKLKRRRHSSSESIKKTAPPAKKQPEAKDVKLKTEDTKKSLPTKEKDHKKNAKKERSSSSRSSSSSSLSSSSNSSSSSSSSN